MATLWNANSSIWESLFISTSLRVSILPESLSHSHFPCRGDRVGGKRGNKRETRERRGRGRGRGRGREEREERGESVVLDG